MFGYGFWVDVRNFVGMLLLIFFDYWFDTQQYQRVGKVHTIWMKGKDPRKNSTYMPNYEI